jgi:PhnB protein
VSLNPYLNFPGNCAVAFKTYEKVLGGRIVMMQTHAETPARDFVPADWQDKIIHVRLEVGGAVLMGSDAPPGRFDRPQGFAVSFTTATPAEAERIFNELAEDGKVTMPFAPTFWSPGFGMVVDRFGIPWMVMAEPAAQAA